MAKSYKITQEIIDFILEQKKSRPHLSCRNISRLITAKFQTKLSKSTINNIIKPAGLSLPAGRRSKDGRLKIKQPIASQEDTKLLSIAPSRLPAVVPAEPVAQPIQALIPEPAVPQPISAPPPQPPAPEPLPEPPEPAPQETISSGAVLLKAADHLLGGAYSFNTLADNKLRHLADDLLSFTEGAIYLPLFEADKNALPALWALIGQTISLEDLLTYINELQSADKAAGEMARIIPGLLLEGRSLKANFSDGSSAYLDGQLHTVWSTQYLPYSFSSTICNIKSYISKHFYENAPLVLFMAPGSDTPTQEFFDLLMGLSRRGKKIDSLVVYGPRLEELKVIKLEERELPFFIFGLWPWQFTAHRLVKKIGEFRPFFFQPQQKEFFLAEVEIDLLQPIDKQRFSFKGCALKTSATGNVCLIILSDLPDSQAAIENLAAIYLGHWPNLAETLEDFNRKVEFFTYVGSPRQFLSPEIFGFNRDISDIKQIFGAYLNALDFYVKSNFLPAGYENKDFSTTKERFYDLKTLLKQEKTFMSVVFQVPLQYPYRQDLEYACRRLNEKQIQFFQNPVWFSIEEAVS